MLLSTLLLIVGFVLLIKGADWLVTGASSLAKRFNISELVIGLTIVAFGTSSPELVVNILAAFRGSSDIALGNIIGSNNFNTYVILGITGMIYPLSVGRSTIWREIPYSLLTGLIILLVANDIFVNNRMPNTIDRTDGVLLLLFFLAFLYYAYLSMQTETPSVQQIEEMSTKRSLLFTFGGLAVLIIGGKFVVDNAVDIARFMGISEKFIGLTVVAAGTSLPELVTSVVAALKKRSDIAVGNVVGSNIFNVFFVLGLSSVIQPLDYNVVFNTDCIVFIIGNILLFGTMFTGKRNILDRWQAAILFLLFVGYTGYLFVRQ